MVYHLLGWNAPVFAAPFRLPGLWMGRVSVRWRDPCQGLPPQRSHHRGAHALRFLCGGAADLVFSLLLEECDLVGVGALLSSLSFKDFHHVARLRSLASGLQG
jgi:hypothetical protein